MSKKETLLTKIDKKEAVGSVIGLGYVGLPLLLEIDRAGFVPLGFDIDPAKVEKLLQGKSYIRYIPDERIKDLVTAHNNCVTADYDRLRESDVIAVCVPTPLNRTREPDLSYVENTVREIAGRLRPGQLVVLESTTYPGTTDELVLPILAGSDLKVGEDFFLAFAPEREDPGNQQFTTSQIPRVVGGITPACREVAHRFYSAIFEKVHPVSSTRVAETTKLLENIYRAVNIALVNEMKLLCDRMGMDIWEVIEAASTKPFGYTPFFPGPGLGGHCIPIDPFYLTWKAREYDMPTRFIELAGEINTFMPYHVVDKVVEALGRQGKPAPGAKVLLLGVAYKKDVEDVRESPALKIIELLRRRGIEVSYHDPLIPVLRHERKEDPHLSSVELSDQVLRETDCVLIVTNHSVFDYERLLRLAPLVVDTRNATKGMREGREKIVKA
jgi:UDP-N-acetyl-D-glucosamine dehydrogenase